MLRWIAFCTGIVCISASAGRGVEPARPGDPARIVCPLSPVPHSIIHDRHLLRLTLLSSGVSVETAAEPKPAAIVPAISLVGCQSVPDRGLPESESELLAQQRWAKMPAFEIAEEPLPSPMALVHPPVCLGPPTAAYPTPPMEPRYALAPSVGRCTATDAAGVPEPAIAELSPITLPTPSADPAAMVIELFEKLKVSQEHAAEARRQLAQAQRALAELRSQATVSSPEPASDVVLLELRCFELDLGALAESELELTGVCREELSQVGLAALVAGGAFANCCCPGLEAQGPATAEGACTTCGGCAGGQVAAGPGASGQATDCTACRFVEDSERFERLLGELEKAKLIRHISRPRLMTRSGQSARLTVGQEIPVTMTTTLEDGRTAETVNVCRAGTHIEAQAVAHADGTVRIELQAEWSAVDEPAHPEDGYPVIHRQEIQSIVELPAGRTAVVAGLVQERNDGASRLPVVTQVGVPVPGKDRIFKNVGVGRTQKRTEVVVLVTPKIATPLARTAVETTQR